MLKTVIITLFYPDGSTKEFKSHNQGSNSCGHLVFDTDEGRITTNLPYIITSSI